MTEINALKNRLPIDIASALDRIGGDKSFLYDLVMIFIEDFLEKFKNLKKAVEGQDFETIKDIGHNLKGSSANLSLPCLQEISFEIETAGRERDIEKARENLPLLEEEFYRLKDFVAKTT